MNTLTNKLSNGNEIIYQLIQDGENLPIAYHSETSKQLIQVLEYARKNKTRIKVYLGDPKTGKNWNEENDTMGYIGLIRGTNARFPILVNNARSFGGGSIMDNCIVKIRESKGKRVLYQCANFQASNVEIKEGSNVEGYTHEVFINNSLYSRHKSLISAERLKAKMI
jgi:hypothetical protein